MAKVGKKKRMPAVATSAPKHAGAKENVKAKAKEKANDFGKGKAFDKAQGIAPDNTPASGNFDVVLGLIQAARARAVTAVKRFALSKVFRLLFRLLLRLGFHILFRPCMFRRRRCHCLHALLLPYLCHVIASLLNCV